MEIVTGSTGEVHVTPIDDAVRNASVGYLDKKIVFDVYDVFAATIVANREIHVSSGYGENQGRIFKIDDGDYDSVPIENGTQGAKRADLIVARYSMDVQTGFEDISLAVIKGELSTTSYIDPSYETGDINSAIVSSTFHDDFPLYRVRLDGIQIVGIDRLFTPAPDGGRIGVLEAAFEAHKARFESTNYRTNLASESAVYPSRVDADGQGNINVRPGVEGVLPASHGGTGQSNLKSGAIGLIGALDANGTTPSANGYYVGTTPNVSGYQRKPLSALWEFIKAKVIEFMGLSGSGVVPVAKGGTGKTSIGNGKVLVGNASGGFDERGIDTTPNGSSNNLITSKGVADAMGRAGYGDMMKSTYDPNEDGIIGLAQGGTGTQDGTINGVRLYKNGDRYGYMDGNTFKSFRQPTGNAQAAQVLRGYTFANATSDSLSGSMEPHEAVTACESVSWGGTTDNLYVRFPRGAYLENASFGYPEIRVPGTDLGDATQANVLSGKTFTSVSGLKKSGTMANCPAITQRTSLAFTSPYFYARFPQGAYLTNASSGYPEIQLLGSDMGDAAQANVLGGKTFTSASGLKLPGTMVNYSGANRCIVVPTGGTGNEQLALNRGYHDSVIVNRNGPYTAGYNAGIAAQKAEKWEETWEIEYMANDHSEHIPVNSISRIKATWTGGNQGPILYWYDSAGNPISSQTMASNTWYNVPTNYTVKEAVIMAWARQTVHPIVTRYANKLR